MKQVDTHIASNSQKESMYDWEVKVIRRGYAHPIALMFDSLQEYVSAGFWGRLIMLEICVYAIIQL